MNRTLLLMAVAAVATSGVKAQSVTYNHDSPKQNQIKIGRASCRERVSSPV